MYSCSIPNHERRTPDDLNMVVALLIYSVISHYTCRMGGPPAPGPNMTPSHNLKGCTDGPEGDEPEPLTSARGTPSGVRGPQGPLVDQKGVDAVDSVQGVHHAPKATPEEGIRTLQPLCLGVLCRDITVISCTSPLSL